jgi:hypothetical protein
MSIDPRGWWTGNRAPAVGVVMHWTGHTDDPIDCGQPKCGYLPTIASWHEWDEDSGDGKFSMWLKLANIKDAESSLMLETGESYILEDTI